MDNLIQEKRSRLYTRLVLRIVLWVLGILLLRFAGPPLLSLLAPFLAAFLVALALNPLVSKIRRKWGLPRRLIAFVLVILVFLILAALISWAVYIVVREVRLLSMDFQAIWASVEAGLASLYTTFAWVLDFFPTLKDINVMETLNQWLQSLSQEFLDSPGAGFAGVWAVTAKAGKVLLGVLIFMMAAYCITAEYPTIARLMEKYLGNRIYGYVRLLKNTTQSALWKYFKAQLLLALLAFTIMFVALVIYGQSYAFLIALLLAFFDFLPLLGTGIILVPWALVAATYGGDIVKAIFLLALSGGFFLIRRLVEPKILGSQTGLHPLVALLSIYIGLVKWGIWGAICAPLVVMVAVRVYNTRIFDHTIRDIRAVLQDVGGLFHRRRTWQRGEKARVKAAEVKKGRVAWEGRRRRPRRGTDKKA
jgi:sporulation integral membrane protein YtvI